MRNQERLMSDSANDRITKTPGVCGGSACIAGHRIRVADIVVWHEQRGYSADEIVGFFPGLSLSDVHSALAYYFDHREEIQSDLAADREAEDSLSERFPSRLREKLGA
jgi:uncharacterized protein (DUF433 family)